MESVKHIVIYDDLQMDATRVKRELRKLPLHHEVFIAKNGKELRSILAEVEVDILLADYAVPGFSGLDALRYVRINHPNTLVVFVTGTLHNEELAAETILTGASGYVLKQNLVRLPKVIIDLLAEHKVKSREHNMDVIKRYQRNQYKLNQNLDFLLERIQDNLNNMEDRIEGVDEFLGELEQFRRKIGNKKTSPQDPSEDSA